jgi:hypothetical protein
MASVQDNFTVDAGGSFTRLYEYKVDGEVVNLTGYLARGQVRKSTFTNLILDFVPVIDEETYEITLTWTPEQTSLLLDSNYVYGLEVYNESTGDVAVVARGVVTVNQRIVRS